MRLTLFFIFLISISAMVKADTLTITSNQSVNGLVTYQLEEFTIEAKFKDNVTKTYVFERRKVKSIEINRTYVNQGPPPSWINKFEAVTKPNKGPKVDIKTSQKAQPVLPPDDTDPTHIPGTRPPSKAPDDPPPPFPSAIDDPTNIVPYTEITDEVRFNDGEKRIGKLILISSDTITVSVSKREIPYSRDLIHTILVGH